MIGHNYLTITMKSGERYFIGEKGMSAQETVEEFNKVSEIIIEEFENK